MADHEPSPEAPKAPPLVHVTVSMDSPSESLPEEKKEEEEEELFRTEAPSEPTSTGASDPDSLDLPSESDGDSDDSLTPKGPRSNSSMELFRSKVVDPFMETYSNMIEQKDAMKRKFQGLMQPNTEPRYYSHPFRYDAHVESWTVIPYQTLNERKFKGHHLRSLRLLTYNIWFHEDDNFDARAEALMKILHDSNADIIGLQEVIPRFLKILTSKPWVRENYFISELTGESFCGYGNIIMTTMRPRCFYTRPLESLMGRQLIMSEFALSTPAGNDILRVGTVHMESLAGNYELRNFQFKQIFPLLTDPVPGYKHVHCFLMGDFNLDPCSQEEVDTVQTQFENFVDCWTNCCHGSPGGTRYVNYPEEGKNPVRFDRIILHTKEQRIVPQTVVTIGKEALQAPSLESSYDRVYPSDHLGLLCECRVQYGSS